MGKKKSPKKAVYSTPRYSVSRKGMGGVPSTYKPEYCQMLIDHMATGLSWETFAAVVRVSDDTLRNWANAYPEFLNAKREGTVLNRLKWEQLGLDGLSGKIDGFNAATYIFNMKNRFGWRDKTEISGGEEPVKVEYSVSDTLLKKIDYLVNGETDEPN